MPSNRTYKVRRFQNGRSKDGEPFYNYSLTIPSAIAEALPEGMQYECQLTDEGILFRPATQREEQVQLPAWAQVSENGGGGGARAQGRK